MNFPLVIFSTTCLCIFVAPASSISLLGAAAAVKGVVVGAGLSALTTSGGSETVIIQSQAGSVAEVVPANQLIIQDFAHKPVTVHNTQTITYTSSNPLSRLWGVVSNVISAKTKAIGDLFQPNRVVIIMPHTTTTTTPKPTHKPIHKPVITIDFEHKPLVLPSIELSASIGRGMFEGVQPVVMVNYEDK